MYYTYLNNKSVLVYEIHGLGHFVSRSRHARRIRDRCNRVFDLPGFPGKGGNGGQVDAERLDANPRGRVSRAASHYAAIREQLKPSGRGKHRSGRVREGNRCT